MWLGGLDGQPRHQIVTKIQMEPGRHKDDGFRVFNVVVTPRRALGLTGTPVAKNKKRNR